MLITSLVTLPNRNKIFIFLFVVINFEQYFRKVKETKKKKSSKTAEYTHISCGFLRSKF